MQKTNDEKINAIELRDFLEHYLDKIDKRYKDIITSHFGCFGNAKLKTKEIALKHGITVERVRQIRLKAIRLLFNDVLKEKRIYETR